MKKIYTLLCIAATMLAACAKENLVENDTTPQDEEVKYIDVSFEAEFPVPAELQDNAKTMLNSDLSVSWSEGDQIAVNNDEATMDKTVLTAEVNPQDPHKAIFSGKINEKAKNFFAVYPAADVEIGQALGFLWSDGNIYLVLPHEQTAKEGSFANGCALSYANGTVSGGVMQNTVEFHNLCAILEFTMPDYVVGAQTVNIKSNDGKNISGGCVLNREKFTLNSFKASDKKKTTYDNVTVTAPNTASKFYAVIFPDNYSNGFTITVTTAGGQTYSRNVTKALKADANHIYNLGTLGVVLDEEKVDLAVNIEQNIKTGSVATFNIAANGDFKDMVKSWDINLYNSADQLVRKIEGNTTGSGTLETVGDFKLLAAGDYYATVTYFMQTGSKRAALNFTGFKAEQFKVEGVVVDATTELNYEGGTLNGTDVELSFDTSAVDEELAKLINWTDIELTDANGVIYRTATAAGKMTPAEGKPYLPNGEYTLTAYFTLPKLGSTVPTKLDPKQITVNHTPNFGVSLTSAKTSYDYYKVGDINQANDCKNVGVYELAAKMTDLSISNEVATQMIKSGKFYYEWFLDSKSIGTTDGNATVSNISKNTDDGAVQVDFGTKNVNCKLTFDNIVKESGNIAVNITGLPFTETFDNVNSWDRTNNTKKNDVVGLRLGGDTGQANATLKNKFSVPQTTSVKVLSNVYLYTLYYGLGYQRTTYSVSIGGNTLISKESNKTKNVEEYFSLSEDANITGQDNTLVIKSSCSTEGPYSRVTYLRVEYR